MKRLFYLFVALFLATAVADVGAQCGPNLLTNEGFEDAGGSFNGWFSFPPGPGGPAIDNTIFRSGAASAKIFGVFSNCPIPTFDVSGFGQALTPTAGNIYELSGYAYMSSGDPIPATGSSVCDENRVIAQIAFFDAPVAGGVIASNEVIIGDASTVLDQWNAFSISLPAPSGALRVEALFLFLQPGCDTGSVYVDDVTLCESPPTVEQNLLANPSFDTDLSGWTAFGNVSHDGRTQVRRTPTGSAKMFGPFANPGDASGMFQQFPAVQGSEWTFGVYSLTSCGLPDLDPIAGTNQNFGTIKMVFLDDLGTQLDSVETVILDNSSPQGTWVPNSVTLTAPAGTDSVRAFVLFIQPDSLENGSMWVDDASLRQATVSAIRPVESPAAFELHQNVPNPFNPTTRIDFVLQNSDVVNISVYDVKGRRVTILQDGRLDAGPHNVTWAGRAANGALVASGVYMYVMTTSTGQIARNMVLIK